MATPLSQAIHTLHEKFMERYPQDTALILEKENPKKMASFLVRQPLRIIIPVIENLPFDTATEYLQHFPEPLVISILETVRTNVAVSILSRLTDTKRTHLLSLFSPTARDEMNRLLTYSPDSAGHIMDTHVIAFRDNVTVQNVLNKLRRMKTQNTRSLYVVDESNMLVGKVSFEKLALAKHKDPITSIMQPIIAATNDFSPRDEVVENFEKYKVTDIPIIDVNGIFLGVVYHDKLMQELETQAMADMQTMVGASKDERALSPPLFVVSKRLPWLEINLLTAFLAASVVGLFESLIAQYTALAVLLPVVAGQSGNAGAQALAVTMRSLAIREISIRQWFTVLRKEVLVGLLNGIAIALTTAAGVFVWSGSLGLAIVICTSMILAMIMAGIAGVLVPIMLTKFGQDPAQSSSIILTTVTDVAGFFSFLGIALLLSRYL